MRKEKDQQNDFKRSNTQVCISYKSCNIWIRKTVFLIVRNIDKTIKEQDIFKRISLLGDIIISVKTARGRSLYFAICQIGSRRKIGILADLLKPGRVESIFARYNPVTMKIHSSDLEIMKCLLSDPRLRIEDIAKETSLSTRTVARRLEKMIENQILQFTILIDLSSTQLTGFIVFIVLIDVNASYHQKVVQRIYNEMKEYLLHPLMIWYNIQLTLLLAIRMHLYLHLSVVQTFLQST